jgi:hypothetical protein
MAAATALICRIRDREGTWTGFPADFSTACRTEWAMKSEIYEMTTPGRDKIIEMPCNPVLDRE